MSERFKFVPLSNGIVIRLGEWPVSGKGRGKIILLNGRREFMEKYLETIKTLNQKGYHVFSFDWRGQGRSSRMLPDRHKGYVNSYQDYLDDLSYLFKNQITFEDETPNYLLAHSMGAHIALRILHGCPIPIAKAVLVSPMIDISTFPFPRRVARILTNLAVKFGYSQSYIFGRKKYGILPERFEGNPLTSDPDRFWDEHRLLLENPELFVGGVTWGWLQATFKSIDLLTAPGYAEKIHTSIMMVCAQHDTIVSYDAQQSICSRLNRSRLVWAPNARHEILRENRAIRTMFWEWFDQFISGQN